MSDQAEKGGAFQFLGGNISGKFLEVEFAFWRDLLFPVLSTVGGS
jgi:hypothetical protein